MRLARFACSMQMHKLASNIDEHWAKAESMGHNLMRVLKIKTLTDQARFIPAYHNGITNLQDNRWVSGVARLRPGSGWQ